MAAKLVHLMRNKQHAMTLLLLGVLSITTALLLPNKTSTPIRLGQGNIRTFDISPDNQLFVIGSAGGLYLYRVDDLTEVWSDETSAAITDVSFGYDGKKIIAALSDGRIILWDIVYFNRVFEVQVSASTLAAVSPSPDGTRFASGDGSGNVVIWSSTGERQRDLAVPHDNDEVIYDLAFSPDGTMLAATSYWDTALIVWDTSTWEQVFSFERAGVHVAWSYDSARLGTSMNGHYNVWDTTTWEHLVHHVEEREFGNIVFKPNSRDFDISGAWTRTAYTSDGVYKFSQNYYWREFLVFNLENQEARTLKKYNGYSYRMFFSPDDRYLIVPYQDRLTIWDANTGTLIREYEFPEGFRTITTSEDGRFFATGLDSTGSIILWDAETLQALDRFDTSYDAVDRIVISPSGNYMAAGVMGIEEAESPLFSRVDGYALITWDLTPSNIVHQSPEQDFRVLNFEFYPDSSELMLGNDPFAWSPDGRYFASAVDDELRDDLWYALSLQDTETGATLFTVPTETQRIEDIEFNPDGTILATAEPNGVYLWEVPGGALLGKLEQGSRLVAWSHDGKRLATSSPEGLVYIWNIDQLRTYP